VEVTIKQGFSRGRYDGELFVSLEDIDSGHKFYVQRVFRESVKNDKIP
jgi:hypothetical protein